MSKKEVILTSKYVIIHGQFYEVSDDELMHWKYIKREKVNGKWRYYYHDDAVDKAKINYNRALKAEEYLTKQRDKIVAENNEKIGDILIKYNKSEGNPAYYNLDDPTSIEIYNEARPYLDANNNIRSKVSAARTKLSKAKTNYNRAKAVANKSFGNKVADFLNKTSNAANKAKKWIKNLFS